MVIPPDRATRSLQSLAYRVVYHLISHNDVAALAEAGDDARNGRESMSIDDGSLGAEERGNVRLSLHVNILCTVELWRTTGADAVGAQSLDRLFLDGLASVEVVEVVRSKIGHRPAVSESNFRTCWAAHHILVSTLNTQAKRPAPSTPEDVRRYGSSAFLPDDYGYFLSFALLEGSPFSDEGLWLPFPDQLVDLILSQLDIVGAVSRIRR